MLLDAGPAAAGKKGFGGKGKGDGGKGKFGGKSPVGAGKPGGSARKATGKGAGFMASANWITCPTHECQGKWFHGDNTPVSCRFCKQPTDLSLREGRSVTRGQANGKDNSRPKSPGTQSNNNETSGDGDVGDVSRIYQHLIKEGLPVDKADQLLKGAGVEVPPSTPVSHPRAGADLPDFTRASRKRTNIAKMLTDQQGRASRLADQALEAQTKCDELEQSLIEADAELASIMAHQSAPMSVSIASKRAEDHPVLKDMIDTHAAAFMQRGDASDEAKSEAMTMIFNMVSLFNSDLAQQTQLSGVIPGLTVFPDNDEACNDPEVDSDVAELPAPVSVGAAGSSSVAPSPGPGFPKPDLARLKEISAKSKNRPRAPRPGKIKNKFDKVSSPAPVDTVSIGDEEFDDDPLGHGSTMEP